MTAPTLEQVPMLTATQQYRQAIDKIQRPTVGEEALLVEQARNGSQEAKWKLIEGCLKYIFVVGYKYSVYLSHDELLDLVQLANLRVVELFELALEKGSPAAYLRGVACREIQQYCTYRSTLIVRARRGEKPNVVFLQPYHEQIPESVPTYKEVQMTAEQAVDIIQQLPEPYRTVMLRATGLDGELPENFQRISKRLYPHYNIEYARSVWKKGVAKAATIIKESGISYETKRTRGVL
jgi:hypothetical protein